MVYGIEFTVWVPEFFGNFDRIMEIFWFWDFIGNSIKFWHNSALSGSLPVAFNVKA